MKRTISILLSLTLLLAFLPACTQTAAEPDPPAPESEEPAAAAQDLTAAAFALSGRSEELNTECLNANEDPDRLAVYIEAVCGLTGDQWEDAAVIRGLGASAFEILVLRLPDEAAAGEMEAVLTDYLTARQGAFTGYAPAQAEMASNGRVLREGQYVGLFICPDPAGAEDAFTAVYSGEALPEPPPEPESDPEPAEEPVPERFMPTFAMEDLLFRLLLEAVCPDWGALGRDKAWTGGKGWAEEIEAQYGITTDQFEDYVSAFWGPYTYEYAEEPDMDSYLAAFFRAAKIELFRTATEEGAREVAQILNGYKDRRLEELEEKKAEAEDVSVLEAVAAEEEALQNALAVSFGHYAALIISEYSETAVQMLPRAVNDSETGGYFQRFINGARRTITDPDPDYPDRTRFTPQGTDDMSIYDTSAILAAWEAGDPSGLSGDDAAIYGAAEAILDEVMTDGMTDLEKEAAAYRWLVNNVNYDWTHQDALAETDRRSYGPYGGLVNRTAVCLGYTTSFQLLMDMSGVECVIIVGAAFNSTADHAWNMVKLNGEWYCVEVTWDANAREQFQEEREWRYFNLTSDEMAENHQWDYANTPEATAEDRGLG